LSGTAAGKTKYRKKTRELLMRLIFQMSMTGVFTDAAKEAFLADKSLYSGNVQEEEPLGCFFDEKTGESPDLAYFNRGFECLRDHLSEIDAALAKVSEGWAVQRMGTTELSIMRVAVAEMLYIDEIDAGVSVNEAVVLAKKYGSEKSAPYVNGVLGAVTRS